MKTKLTILIVLALVTFGGTTLLGKNDPLKDGKEIFESVCADCHRVNGEGLPPTFPALNNNASVTAGDPAEVIKVVLNGRKAKVGTMPSWKDRYDNSQLAAVITYIRQSWSNKANPVTPDMVEKLRR